MEKHDLDDGRETLAAITSMLVTTVDLRGASKWKLPGKVRTLRESLLWRIEELARNAFETLDTERYVAAALATRALMETAAALVFLESLMDHALRGGVTDALVRKFDRFLINSKVWEELEDPIHINDMLREVEERIPGYFTVRYASLSEYAHPNYMGTFGAFGEFDKANFLAIFRKGGRMPENRHKIISLKLAATLHVAKGYYQITGRMFQDFAKATEAFYAQNPPQEPATQAR